MSLRLAYKVAIIIGTSYRVFILLTVVVSQLSLNRTVQEVIGNVTGTSDVRTS